MHLNSEPGRSGLVTVIVPSYNYAHFIAQTLDSVLVQTYPNWECIVVDDGSTDNTRELVERYTEADRRIKYTWQENQGLAAARNAGIAQSSGEYLQFLDADDLIEARKLECQVGFLENYPEIDIVYSDVLYLASEKSELRFFTAAELNIPSVVKLSGLGRELLLALVRSNIAAVNSLLLRRQVVYDVGLFEGGATGDYEYWVRCALEGKRFHFEDIACAHSLVRLHPTSMSRDRRRMIKSELLLHRRVATTVRDREVLRLNQQRVAELEGQLGIEEATDRHSAQAIHQFYKAFKLDRRLRHRAKWLAYAGTTPFVTPERLRTMVNFISRILNSMRG